MALRSVRFGWEWVAPLLVSTPVVDTKAFFPGSVLTLAQSGTVARAGVLRIATNTQAPKYLLSIKSLSILM
jgi:hypothetical protein